jgi:RNA polymerase sigma factor (sigma-70 family)
MTSLETLTDAELIGKCRDGNQAAWGVLVRRFQRLIYTIPRRAGLSEEQAADVFQVAFSRLFENLSKLGDDSRVQAWLVTTAKRESLRLLEQARRIVDLTPVGGDDDGDDSDPLDRFADESPLPEQQLSDLQQQDRLRRALALIDERSRKLLEMLFMRDDDDKPSYQQIAAELGIAEGSIGPTRARALAKLREALAKL